MEFVSVIKSTISIHFMFKATEATCLTKVKALLWFKKEGAKVDHFYLTSLIHQ